MNPRGTSARTAGSTREEADNYRAIVVCLNDDWRVIVCRVGIQWIIQRHLNSRTGATDRWRGMGYHRNREALLDRLARDCGVVRDDMAVILASLPEWIEEDRR